MKEDQFYCLSCHKVVKVPMADVKIATLRGKNGKILLLKSKCSCDTKLRKFASKDDKEHIKRSIRKSKRSLRRR